MRKMTLFCNIPDEGDPVATELAGSCDADLWPLVLAVAARWGGGVPKDADEVEFAKKDRAIFVCYYF